MHKENSSQCFQAQWNLASCLNPVPALFSQWNFRFVILLQNTPKLLLYVIIALLLVCLPSFFSVFLAFLSCFCLLCFFLVTSPSSFTSVLCCYCFALALLALFYFSCFSFLFLPHMFYVDHISLLLYFSFLSNFFSLLCQLLSRIYSWLCFLLTVAVPMGMEVNSQVVTDSKPICSTTFFLPGVSLPWRPDFVCPLFHLLPRHCACISYSTREGRNPSGSSARAWAARAMGMALGEHRVSRLEVSTCSYFCLEWLHLRDAVLPGEFSAMDLWWLLAQKYTEEQKKLQAYTP